MTQACCSLVLRSCSACIPLVLLLFPGDAFCGILAAPPNLCLTLTAKAEPLLKQNRVFLICVQLCPSVVALNRYG